jgi:3-oxoacyl-[acyl-carrier-protein] synthase-3
VAELTDSLLAVLRQVVVADDEAAVAPDALLADVLDSMGLAEYVGLLARRFGVAPAAIEACVASRFATVAELAAALEAAGLAIAPREAPPARARLWPTSGWLSAVAARLPAHRQPAAELDAALGRPADWLTEHAGIHERRIWGDEDPLAAASEAGSECLERARLTVGDVGALLVTSEAPPLLAGLAAALHHRIGLPGSTPALEVGGACTGFLAALWTAQALLPHVGGVLVLALEAPSRHLRVCPGPAGEAAALFGDAAAAGVLCPEPTGTEAVALTRMILGGDGGEAHLLRAEYSPAGAVEIHMDGRPLAIRAVRVMADLVTDMAKADGMSPADLDAVVVHGGNGRFPALIARQLGLPPQRVLSTTAHTGNLGSASLPVAWAECRQRPSSCSAWVAAGAGLSWAGALLGSDFR